MRVGIGLRGGPGRELDGRIGDAEFLNKIRQPMAEEIGKAVAHPEFTNRDIPDLSRLR